MRGNNHPHISAGRYHSLLLDSRGQVFSFGSNKAGQLGIPDARLSLNRGQGGLSDTKNTRSSPTQIERGIYGLIFVAISAGDVHSLLLDSLGRVFSFGGNDFGQLGQGHHESLIAPGLLEFDREVMAISAGGCHSLILTIQGQVFSFGGNYFGQLGLRDQEERLVPTLITRTNFGQSLPKIIALSAGRRHSLILDRQGQVFSFGANEAGQLGLGDIMNRYVPTWLETFESNTPIMILSAGSTHSLFLSSPLAGGLVFGCGSNEDNQLGILDTKNLTLIPTLLEDFLDLQVMDISAGDHHSLILSSQGQVLTFGSDKDGTLKLDRSGAGFKLLESPLIKGSSGIKESDYFHPSSVERTREVTAVSAGETHSLILDRHGQVFSFGSMRASIQLQS